MRPARAARISASILVAGLAAPSVVPAPDGSAAALPVTRASARAVRYLKSTPASSIDTRLPSVPFEQWVADTLGSDAAVSWEAGTCNIVLPRVLAESGLCVELNASLSTSAGGIHLFIDVGTFGGLRPPRLDSGSFWRQGREGRESGWLADLAQLLEARQLFSRSTASSPAEETADVRGARAQLALVRRVQELPASSVDSDLPAVRLATWARQTVGADVDLGWSIGDCDLMASDEVCVKVDGRHRGGARAKVHLRTGTDARPWSGRPEVVGGLAYCGRDHQGIQSLAEFARAFAREGWDRCE